MKLEAEMEMCSPAGEPKGTQFGGDRRDGGELTHTHSLFSELWFQNTLTQIMVYLLQGICSLPYMWMNTYL